VAVHERCELLYLDLEQAEAIRRSGSSHRRLGLRPSGLARSPIRPG
jgi:hypothetical protein